MGLAIFDLDNTLIAGDSDVLWGEFLVDNGIVNEAFYRDENQRFYDDYNNGTLDINAYLAFSLKALSENKLSDLLQWRSEFIATKIKPIVLPKAIELIERHKNANDVLLIITATNRFVTEPIADLLNIPHLLATDPEMINNRYTGNVQGIPCFQIGKVKRLNSWLSQHEVSLNGSYFYSDSHNDIPLLETVTNAIVVDADETLKKTASERNWKMLSLR